MKIPTTQLTRLTCAAALISAAMLTSGTAAFAQGNPVAQSDAQNMRSELRISHLNKTTALQDRVAGRQALLLRRRENFSAYRAHVGYRNSLAAARNATGAARANAIARARADQSAYSADRNAFDATAHSIRSDRLGARAAVNGGVQAGAAANVDRRATAAARR